MFYREWYNSVILALLDVCDFRDDFLSLSTVIYPPISQKKVRESINLLKELELIKPDDKGFWRPSHKAIATSDYIQEELVKQYQMQCLELAKNAIVAPHLQQQDISTTTLSVSELGYNRIQQLLNKFRHQVRSCVNKDSQPADRVYQLDIQLFPTSRILNRSGS